MTVKSLREFIFENAYKQTGFTKEDSHYSFKKQRKRRFSNTCYKLSEKLK